MASGGQEQRRAMRAPSMQESRIPATRVNYMSALDRAREKTGKPYTRINGLCRRYHAGHLSNDMRNLGARASGYSSQLSERETAHSTSRLEKPRFAEHLYPRCPIIGLLAAGDPHWNDERYETSA